MTIQISMAKRNARLDVLEEANGILKIRSGAVPTDCAAADQGTVVATLDLPADNMADAANAQKDLAGTWDDPAADAAGTAGHWRYYAADGVTCHMQGTVTNTGGGGDMEVQNTNFALGQPFEITTFQINEPNG